MHGKRILGGNTSRNPEFNFQYFAEDPTLARFIGLVDGADLAAHTALRAELDAQPVTANDRERARAWAAFLGLRYVMVHRDAVPPAAEALLGELLEPELWAVEGNLALYRVRPESPPARFDVATAAGRSALGFGWGPALSGGAWSEGDEAELLLPLAGRSTLRLGLRAAGPGATVELSAGGRSLGVHPIAQDGTTLVLALPPGAAVEDPLTRVRLRFSAVVPAIDIAGRGGTLPVPDGRAFPAALLVASAGTDTGDFGRVYLDGVQAAPDRRGYNVAAFDPQGRLLASAAFDTHLDPAAGTRLRDWLAAQPVGAVVAGAVRDEGSLALDQAGVDGLRLVGVTGDLRGKFRCAHAFIGVRGSAPGQAAESLACSLPVRQFTGLPLSAPGSAGRVEVIELE